MELSGCHRARVSDSTPPGVYDTARANHGAAQAARQGGDFGQEVPYFIRELLIFHKS